MAFAILVSPEYYEVIKEVSGCINAKIIRDFENDVVILREQRSDLMRKKRLISGGKDIKTPPNPSKSMWSFSSEQTQFITLLVMWWYSSFIMTLHLKSESSESPSKFSLLLHL